MGVMRIYEDYDLHTFMSWLDTTKPDVPLILHGLTEAQVDGCVAFLRDKMAALNQ